LAGVALNWQVTFPVVAAATEALAAAVDCAIPTTPLMSLVFALTARECFATPLVVPVRQLFRRTVG